MLQHEPSIMKTLFERWGQHQPTRRRNKQAWFRNTLCKMSDLVFQMLSSFLCFLAKCTQEIKLFTSHGMNSTVLKQIYFQWAVNSGVDVVLALGIVVEPRYYHIYCKNLKLIMNIFSWTFEIHKLYKIIIPIRSPWDN